ncbi:sel1 repeat family protein [Pseudomonas sp. C9-3]|uniref:SEL1-like repeat protein n=1 Tax=Pseudomonas sp. C9-3 TaxID=3078264 RepID=UPI0028E9D9DB|nr:sel1 repeat family protein [Pseudomonas sp. C9-3]
MKKFLLLTSMLLSACGVASYAVTSPIKGTVVDSLSNIKANLDFTCKYEELPRPTTEAEVLFQYARWLEKNNQLKQDKIVDAQIERFYRIAAENGHAKANINLQNGALRSHYQLNADEHLRMSQKLIDEHVATGYFFVGLFLQRGFAGLKRDPEMALRYYRKAADEGSADAQYYVGEKLEPSDIAPEVSIKMYRCAAEQGQGKAARTLGVYFQEDAQYDQALGAFQLGVKAGDSTSASFIYKGFRNPPQTNELHYLGQKEDAERADRYEKIWSILADYSYANPKVPEINEIVPLPPAKLPPWDGKLKWLEEREANIPPPKPSEALIEQLAKAKGLDPATGKPLPGSQAFIRTDKFQICHSGQACPRAGYWRVHWLADRTIVKTETIRQFKEGDIFPTWEVKRFIVRPWPLKDKTTLTKEPVEWSFYGDA